MQCEGKENVKGFRAKREGNQRILERRQLDQISLHRPDPGIDRCARRAVAQLVGVDFVQSDMDARCPTRPILVQLMSNFVLTSESGKTGELLGLPAFCVHSSDLGPTPSCPCLC
jgi:hypothetical protein